MTGPGDYVIETYNLSKTFGNVQALRGVDLRVPRHSIFGFLGPNGAGKTTLMKALLGLVRPSGGRGKIFGHDIVTESLAIRERIGYLPQQPRFIGYMTARENLLFAARFFFRGPQSRIRDRCEEMLELAGLEGKADRPIVGFSGGEKQRLGIALAQINHPDLLILDEPASALDPLGRQAVLDVMARLRKYTTVFYSTHILDDVQRVSDAVAIMNRGRIVESGPIAQILDGRGEAVYSITVKESSQGLNERLSGLPWVAHISVSRQDGSSIWQVSVSDEIAAETGLLRHILADDNLVVTEFRRKKVELEEVFMEIIQGDGHAQQSGS